MVTLLLKQQEVSSTQYALGSSGCCYYSNSIDIDHNTGSKGLAVYVRGNASNGYYIYATAFTVSGTTITYGTQVVINSEPAYSASMKADPLNADKYMCNWRNQASAGNHHKGCIITLSGTTISKGATVTLHSAGFAMGPSIAWDKFTANSVVAYSDAAGSPDAIACTISGSTITAGTPVNVIGAGHAESNNALQFVSAGKCVFSYRDNSDGYAGKVVIGTVSGTSISLGTPSEYKDSIQQSAVIAIDPNNPTKMVALYGDGGNDGLGGGGGTGDNVSCKIGEIDVAGDSISWGDEYVIDDSYNGGARVIFDPDPAASGQFLITYQDGGNSNYFTHVIGQMGL